jgi:hypothetical protein
MLQILFVIAFFLAIYELCVVSSKLGFGLAFASTGIAALAILLISFLLDISFVLAFTVTALSNATGRMIWTLSNSK